MAESPQPATIPQKNIDEAKAAFARDRPLVDDLRPGAFFDDPNYLDTLSRDAKALICAVQHFGDNPDRPGLCHIQSVQAFVRYVQTNDPDQLTMAFAMEAMSLRYVPPGHPGRGKSNNHMGCLYQQKWENYKIASDLDDTIRHYKIAVDTANETNETISDWSCDVATLVTTRWKLTKQPSDRQDALKYFDKAIELVGDSPKRAIHLSNKGETIRLTLHGNDQEKEALLAESIGYHEQALELCGRFLALSEKPQIPYSMIHRNSAQAHHVKFILLKQPGDAEKAVSLLEKAVNFETVGTASWERYMNELAGVYNSRAQTPGNAEHQEKASKLWHKIIEHRPNTVVARVNLAEIYRSIAADYLGDPRTEETINKATSLASMAVDMSTLHQSKPGLALARYSSVLYTNYELFGNIEDINRAIELAQRATEDKNSDDLWDHYRLLSQTLITRFESLRRLEDLRDAMVAINEAIKACNPEDFEQKAGCQWVLGKLTRLTYDTMPNVQLLRQAIQVFALTSHLMSKKSVTRCLALNDLGNAWAQLFSHEALPEQLEKAIEAYRSSLSGLHDILSTDKHPDILMLNAALGTVMIQRFKTWRAQTDIDSAVTYFRRSLLGVHESHPRYPIRVGNLSYALQLRFQANGVNGSLDDLKETQRLLRNALESPRLSSPDLKNGLLNHLANAFQCSFTVSKQPTDLENAMNYYNEAISIEGVTPAARTTAMLNKAEVQRLTAVASELLSDFEASNRTLEEAQLVLSKDDPHFWTIILQQANLLYGIYKDNGSSDIKDYGVRALAKYKELLEIPSLPPVSRISVASLAASLTSELFNDQAKARDYILISLDMLPEAILMHESRLEQLKFVRTCHYVPSSVAALSLSAGDPPSTVIQRLEAGRAFIWDRIENETTPLDALESQHSELAGKFRTIQQRVFQQGRPSGKKTSLNLTSVVPGDVSRLQRQHDADAYRQVLQEIRALPGHASFLKAPEAPGDLQSYATDAPIVFINASLYRSDALIITRESVDHLPLPAFNMERVRLNAARFMYALDKLSRAEEQAAALTEYQEVMKWLWASAAKPVLDSIDWQKYEAGPSGKPRIIWVSTGWISVLPMHAAGDYESATESEEPTCVHDMVVSSYTTSLKALESNRQSARRINAEPKTSSRQAMIAAMATTPGLGPENDLEVEPEISSFERSLSPTFNANLLRQPDSKSVIDALSTATIAHFACHGRADKEDPSRSAIMLQDNQAKVPPFSVRTLLKLELKTCGLVYLSACESGASKDLSLRDEGIHIAGGFHIAGVPHVISTLWKVSDSVSAQLSGLFYEQLKDVVGEFNLARAPHALHMALEEMKRQGVHPMLLGPFIHSGP
ncbi:hypothetical protein P170DRAFT_433423 [Aspergillus steynii IBT 23096]|uniref:CHAT domain-containing protein n=1 Tax=Aspergillus steynii IBT 23096 TaxID=1392250 RepID=A0A2I2GF13_9EURO|nr:uncharacterized protein P170DRAFT_433423 [Aspergillus steynii IBT 23096]PLB51417.1 hypothetical protein P170DRAFT_433423 [Aspergillus steynii IBT 23096]